MDTLSRNPMPAGDLPKSDLRPEGSLLVPPHAHSAPLASDPSFATFSGVLRSLMFRGGLCRRRDESSPKVVAFSTREGLGAGEADLQSLFLPNLPERRLGMLRTLAQVDIPQAIPSLVLVAKRDPEASIRAHAVSVLAGYAEVPSYRSFIAGELSRHGIRLESELLAHVAQPEAGAIIRLIDTLGEDSKVIRDGLVAVALRPENAQGLRSVAFQSLEARMGVEAVGRFEKIACSATESRGTRVQAVQVLGLVVSELGEARACSALVALADAVPASAMGEATSNYSIRLALGTSACHALLSQEGRARTEMVVRLLGHANQAISTRVCQLLADASANGREVIVPIMRWMDRTEQRILGCQVLQQVDDDLVVPILLGEMERAPKNPAILKLCVSGILRNAHRIGSQQASVLTELLSRPELPLREAAMDLYQSIAGKFPEGMNVCRSILADLKSAEAGAGQEVSRLSSEHQHSEQIVRTVAAILFEHGTAHDQAMLNAISAHTRWGTIVSSVARSHGSSPRPKNS